MNEQARLKLNEMIKENNVNDQTELIRELKHSSIIRQESEILIKRLKENPKATFAEMRDLTMFECNFIFSFYTDIYNRILKQEIEMSLFYKFLDILEKIENGEYGQHEASFKVGTILKELYVDSALKKAEKLDKENEIREKEKESDRTPAKEPMKISWRSYKIQTNKRIAEMNDTHDMEMVD